MSTATEPTRRDFLTLVWVGLGAVALAQTSAVALAFLQPPENPDDSGRVITAGPVANFAPDSISYFAAGHFYLYRQSDGGFLALYRRCPHLGCSILWQANLGQFQCPCHGSTFDISGRVMNPPAPRGLDLLPVTIADGLVKVDTGAVIRRDKIDPTQVVYP